MKRIATLDGWRGIAIALVLFDHVQHALLYRYMRPWTQTGTHGVTIFFVLSGFLITSNLLKGPGDLKRFYIRRFFRLMPAAWTYLAVLLFIDSLTHIHATSLAEFLACVLFYRNFFIASAPSLAGHFWSLSIEEQFYMFWPCILLFAGARRCRWIAAAGAVACAAVRWIFWAHYNHDAIDLQTQVRADALLVGCLLALLFSETRIRAAAARWSKFWTLPALAALLCGMAFFHRIPPLFECVAIAALIAASVLHPHSIFSRPLAFAPLAWLGTVSYSFYLWQELFMPFRSLWALCLAMPLVALCSYYLIEGPSTRFGHRLTSAPAPGISGNAGPPELTKQTEAAAPANNS